MRNLQLLFQAIFAILFLLPVLILAEEKADDQPPPSSSRSSSSKPTITKIAFGSCHKNRRASAPPIWDTICAEEPDAWIWMGDAIYPSRFDPKTGRKRYGAAAPQELQDSFEEMKHNQTIGYQAFMMKKHNSAMPIFGTWDDHDYGGNDMGYKVPLKKERQRAFWAFLGFQPHDHDGMYHSVDLEDGKVQLILLDTRWFRQAHCIPSFAHVPLPMSNAIACATRWWTSGLYLHKFAWMWGMPNCEENQVLGESQWKWLEEALLQNSKADVHIIVSSIQVWTTNPAMESWGQFPKEQERLWDLLQRHYAKPNYSPVVFLSGDVHHGEVSGQPGYLEITSSGLTHHCGEPKLYGRLCQPLLENFNQHRYEPNSFYVGLNYGMLHVDWEARNIQVQVKDASGGTVLQVQQSLDAASPVELPAYKDLPHTWDGHLIPWVRRILMAILVAIVIARRLLRLV
jgi:alkaline phosphatase D